MSQNNLDHKIAAPDTSANTDKRNAPHTISTRDLLINGKLDAARAMVIEADLERQFLEHMLSNSESTEALSKRICSHPAEFGLSDDTATCTAALQTAQDNFDYALLRLNFLRSLRDARKELRQLKKLGLPDELTVSYPSDT